MNGKKIILASASPRRKKILSQMGLNFVVMPSSFDEKLSDLKFAYEKIENLAYQKAKYVKDKNSDSALILSADTVVVLDNTILGKPNDKNEAFLMLRKLSGKTHFVVTSICVLDTQKNTKKIISTTSYVSFNKLSDAQIDYYINKFNPLDKAGAYGIQELPDGFIKEIKGSFENVVGLCPNAVNELLNKCEEL